MNADHLLDGDYGGNDSFSLRLGNYSFKLPPVPLTRTTMEVYGANRTVFLANCQYYQTELQFNGIYTFRVVINCIIIALSLMGNLFFLHCMYRRGRLQDFHIITLHTCYADLVFTVFVMITDTVWHASFWWETNEFFCKALQLMKQIGMFISPFMVVVIAMDQSLNILLPFYLSNPKYKRRFLMGAWITSIVCAIPAAIFFGIRYIKPKCPLDNQVRRQCLHFVNNEVSSATNLNKWLLFTLIVGFVIPFCATSVSYILTLREIKAIQVREQKRMGRWVNTAHNIMRKTYILTSMVTLSYLLFWGPFWIFGIWEWFRPEGWDPSKNSAVIQCLLAIQYLNAVVHPLIYGFFIKDVRSGLKDICRFICSFPEIILRCKQSKGDHSGSPLQLTRAQYLENLPKADQRRKSNESRRTEQETCITPPTGMIQIDTQPPIVETSLVKSTSAY